MKIKPYLDILNGMLTHLLTTDSGVTDINIGGVARTLLESAAVEIDELYRVLFRTISEAIPTAIYSGFGFSKLPAVSSSGFVAITVMNAPGFDVVIPAGTEFVSSSTGYVFKTVDVNYLRSGRTSLSVYVASSTAGIIGNIPARDLSLQRSADISALISFNVLSATNPSEFINGENEESDDSQARRFRLFIKSIQGGTIDAIKYRASVQRIADSSGTVIELVKAVAVYESPGHVYVYVQSSFESTSSAMVNLVSKALSGYVDSSGVIVAGVRPVGMRVDVLPASRRAVNMTVKVILDNGYTKAGVTGILYRAIDNCIRSTAPGTVNYSENIIKAAYAVTGVVSMSITLPEEQVQCAINESLKLGVLTVNV
jgi:hypothetical protein